VASAQAILRDQELIRALGLPSSLRIPQGFLTGVIDLVIYHQNSLWVLDWKTNRLASYSIDSLHSAMLDHYYLLQAAIYLAVLQQRFPHTPVRGARYLFTRGPEVYDWDPQPELIQRLVDIWSPGANHG
jgi:ATP-dependent exoDNAse (exonuclease V) beta subunit